RASSVSIRSEKERAMPVASSAPPWTGYEPPKRSSNDSRPWAHDPPSSSRDSAQAERRHVPAGRLGIRFTPPFGAPVGLDITGLSSSSLYSPSLLSPFDSRSSIFLRSAEFRAPDFSGHFLVSVALNIRRCGR